MKKVNKAAAREWKENVARVAKQKQDLADEARKLYYAAKFDTDYFPSACELEMLGFVEEATLVSKAKALLEEAYYKFSNQYKDY
jgi:hypothetical protein